MAIEGEEMHFGGRDMKDKHKEPKDELRAKYNFDYFESVSKKFS